MDKPKVDSRTITATFRGTEIHVDEPDEARVWVSEDPAFIVRIVRKKDRKRSRKGVIVVTVIEWINVPAGFTPPKD